MIEVNVETVDEVLLADGWHSVELDPENFAISSFQVSTRRYTGRDLSGVYPSPGAVWLELRDGKYRRFSCPLGAILAVKQRWSVK